MGTLSSGSGGAFAAYVPSDRGGSPDPIEVSRLDALAQAMTDGFDADGAAAGMAPVQAFFLAFVAHDLAYPDGTALAAVDAPSFTPLDPAALANGRERALALNAVYGDAGADLDRQALSDPCNPARLRTGRVHPVGFQADTHPHDLPRLADFDDRGETGAVRFQDGPHDPCRAVIADRRNDRHLGLAQLHAAFLRLHNRLVEACDDIAVLTSDPKTQRDWARRHLVACYRWLIRHDLLPALCDPATLAAVLQDEAALFRGFRRASPAPALPLECIGTLDLIADAMLPATLDWNRWFGDGRQGKARLEDLFTMTGEARTPFGGISEGSLPSIWVADWTHLGRTTPAAARPLTTSLSPALRVAVRRMRSYADHAIGDPVRRALRRGHLLGLADGQHVARTLHEGGAVAAPPPPNAFTDGHTGHALLATGLAQTPPLGFHILKEAEHLSGGAHLGPVGTRIVADTLLGLLQESDPRGRWTTPDPPVFAGTPITTLADLLRLAGDRTMTCRSF